MVQSWLNNDKLYLKFGADKATSTPTGEYKTFGPLHTIETKFSASALTSTATINGDVALLPKGALIESVELEVQSATTGGTSVSVGLMKTDRTTTLGDTGIINAETQTNMGTAGKVILYDATTTNHGTLLGTVTTDPGHVTVKSNGTFTTGVLVCRIRYRQP